MKIYIICNNFDITCLCFCILIFLRLRIIFLCILRILWIFSICFISILLRIRFRVTVGILWLILISLSVRIFCWLLFLLSILILCCLFLCLSIWILCCLFLCLHIRILHWLFWHRYFCLTVCKIRFLTVSFSLSNISCLFIDFRLSTDFCRVPHHRKHCIITSFHLHGLKLSVIIYIQDFQFSTRLQFIHIRITSTAIITKFLNRYIGVSHIIKFRCCQCLTFNCYLYSAVWINSVSSGIHKIHIICKKTSQAAAFVFSYPCKLLRYCIIRYG